MSVTFIEKKRVTVATILRWIAVLPTALILVPAACILIFYLINITDFKTWDAAGNNAFVVAEYFIQSLFLYIAIGASSVCIGTLVAPSHKKIVAFVLFGIIAMCVGSLLIGALIHYGLSMWRLEVCCLGSIIASGAVAISEDLYNSTSK